MLVQDGDGRWYDDAGGTGSYHYETQDAASKAMGGGGAGSAAAGNAIAGGFIAVVLFGPIIAAKLVGLIWGLLLKLGMVGKIITTALMLIAGPFITMLPMLFFMFGGTNIAKSFSSLSGAMVFTLFFIAPALIASVWYYFWHYDVVKAMGARVFSNLVMKFAKFGWIGAWAAFIIGFFIKGAGGFISVATIGYGFVQYFIAARMYSQNVERPASFKFRWIGLAAAVGLTVLLGTLTEIGERVEKAKSAREHAQEKAQLAATVANISGETLTVNTAALNLRAEPSGTSRVVRTLNENNTLKATGKLSGLWIPVESGSDRGYVFALSLSLDDKRLGDTLLPIEAATAAPIQLYVDNRGIFQEAQELPQSSAVTFLGNYRWKDVDYIWVEVKNRDYYVYADAAENLVPQLNADGSVVTLSKDKPSEFDRKTPFQATVTEAISAIIRDGSGNWMSIPSGATVTVTNAASVNGISQASVTYNGKESGIHWRYLKLAE